MQQKSHESQLDKKTAEYLVGLSKEWCFLSKTSNGYNTESCSAINTCQFLVDLCVSVSLSNILFGYPLIWFFLDFCNLLL